MKLAYSLGIEVETCVPCGWDNELKYWEHKDDCSINVPNYSYDSAEFASNILRDHAQMRRAIKELCDAAKNQFICNTTCGTHIHVGIYDKWCKRRDYNLFIKRLMLLFMKLEPFLFSLTTSNRINNPYCHPLCRQAAYSDVFRSESFAVASICNHQSYIPKHKIQENSNLPGTFLTRGALTLSSRHNTIEIRLFHGSVKYDQLLAWANICSAIPVLATRLSILDIDRVEPTDYKSIIKLLRLDTKTSEYIVDYLKQKASNTDNIPTLLANTRAKLHSSHTNLEQAFKRHSTILKKLRESDLKKIGQRNSVLLHILTNLIQSNISFDTSASFFNRLSYSAQHSQLFQHEIKDLDLTSNQVLEIARRAYE